MDETYNFYVLLLLLMFCLQIVASKKPGPDENDVLGLIERKERCNKNVFKNEGM